MHYIYKNELINRKIIKLLQKFDNNKIFLNVPNSLGITPLYNACLYQNYKNISNLRRKNIYFVLLLFINVMLSKLIPCLPQGPQCSLYQLKLSPNYL